MEKMTTNELAEKLGVSQPYISQIERDQDRAPSAKLIRNIADIFNVPYGFLLDDKVLTLSEYNAEQSLDKMLDGKRYIPYFVVVDKAIDKGISPQELEEALSFIHKMKTSS